MSETFVSTDGIEEIQKKLDNIKSKVLMENLLKEITPVVQEDIAFRFRTAPSVEQGGRVHGGVNWKPLSNYTIKLNNRAGGQILINTGALMRSSTMQGDSYNIARIEDNTLIFGTAIPYAEKHQPADLLTNISSLSQLDNIEQRVCGDIPPRPFIFFHEELIDKVIDKINEVISDVK